MTVLLVPLLLLITAAGLQFASGSYTADFCGHPDESSHFVTSAMVSEFMRAPFQDPIAFASQYYLQYPKVGIGHWPPLGYLLQGLWIHVLGTSRAVIMAWLLIVGTLSSWLVYELLWRQTGRFAAGVAAMAWLCAAGVQSSYQQAMMDMPALACSLLAVLAFERYVHEPSRRASLLFGFLAACALLVKQQAIILALLPPAYLVVSRRWTLARHWDFWIATVPPILIAGPWYVVTTGMFYKNFTAWSGFAGHGAAATAFHASLAWELCGVGIALLSLVGLIGGVMRMSETHILWSAVLLSAAVCALLFQVLNEPRHLLLGITAQIGLACLATQMAPVNFRPLLSLALIPLSWGWTPAPHSGYAAAAATIDAGPPGHVMLLGIGDGAVIASAAAMHPEADRHRYWLRAGKLLADVRWSGFVSRMYYNSPAEVRDLLRRSGINQVLVEPGHNADEPAFALLLRKALKEEEHEWTVESIYLRNAEASLYRRRTPVPAQSVTVRVPRLGRSITAE